MCIGDNGQCTNSSACCGGCCNSAGVCSNQGGPCRLSAPFQCQTAGTFCNADEPTRRCCLPPLTPELMCLQPTQQACATGFDCCSGCCQGRAGPGLCAPTSSVPDGFCQ